MFLTFRDLGSTIHSQEKRYTHKCPLNIQDPGAEKTTKEIETISNECEVSSLDCIDRSIYSFVRILYLSNICMCQSHYSEYI